jgi:hypothetical protein
MNTYWLKHPRGFQHEYVVAVATTPAWAAEFKKQGYDRVMRPWALRRMAYQGDDVTYVRVLYNSFDADRFELAQALRDGLPVDGCVLWDNGGGLCQ